MTLRIIYFTKHINMDGYFAHINHHLSIGVTAYFMYDIYGDLYDNLYKEWTQRNALNTYAQRIDIFVYHLIEIACMNVHKYCITKTGTSAWASNPYVYQGIIIGLIYWKSLAIHTKWTLFIDLDEFVELKQHTDLVAFTDEKEDIFHLDIQRRVYDASVCYYDHIIPRMICLIQRYLRRFIRNGMSLESLWCNVKRKNGLRYILRMCI
eukprot:588591_1